MRRIALLTALLVAAAPAARADKDCQRMQVQVTALQGQIADMQRKAGENLVELRRLTELIAEQNALLQRALEPYFTTKPADKGTGLGLSISSEILRDIDGGLSLKNGNTGLQAIITVPLAQETSRVSGAAAAQ